MSSQLQPLQAQPDPGSRVDEALLDYTLLGEMLGFGGLEAGILDLFVTQSRARLQDLEQAVRTGNADAVAKVAHSIKGASATFGAARLAATAARLQGPEPAERLALAATLLPGLRALFAETLAAIEAYLPAIAGT